MTDKYRVILADPPWQYNVWGKSGKVMKRGGGAGGGGGAGVAEAYYRTMDTASIKTLAVAELAAKDAALFMWATMPCLPDAFALMAAWGFTYKTVAFTWVKLTAKGKPRMGLGHYTRGNAELCLLGLRGSMTRKANNVGQIILSRPREHSRKPDEQYDRIMALFDGPFIELFARQQWPGWSVAFSNQHTKFLAQPFLFGETFTEGEASA